jgi:hypothetical protein
MGHNIDTLQRIGVKVFLAEAPSLEKIVPVFHRWIQNGSVDGMLIDVADYSHVPEGPGVLLVAHEGNYAVDMGGGRPGLLYYRKQAVEGDLAQRLQAVAAIALRAAAALERDVDAKGAICGDAIQFFANDRLAAPNDADTEKAFQPALDRLLDRLFDGGARKQCRNQDPRERFNVDVLADKGANAATLLARLI